MKYTDSKPRKIRCIRQGDPDFFVTDGWYVAARTGIEFDSSCSQAVKDLILSSISSGKVRLIANVPERELVWEKLQK